jgi:hypothetical protein
MSRNVNVNGYPSVLNVWYDPLGVGEWESGNGV